jgi:2-hydroxychromene-2-carboxylate isomerase
VPEDVSSAAAAFYFDLASPLAYLAAERVLHLLPAPAEWQPVLARDLGGVPEARTSREALQVSLAIRAGELGLQALRLPDPFPFDSALAMRVATYAKSIGRTVPFAQAAFRQAFAGGHSLQDPDYVLIAAAACEMHPSAVLRAADLRGVREQLERATADAGAAGVMSVPAIAAGAVVFEGEDAPERAREYMLASGAAGAGALAPDPQ